MGGLRTLSFAMCAIVAATTSENTAGGVNNTQIAALAHKIYIDWRVMN